MSISLDNLNVLVESNKGFNKGNARGGQNF